MFIILPMMPQSLYVQSWIELYKVVVHRMYRVVSHRQPTVCQNFVILLRGWFFMSGFVELSSPVSVYNSYWIDHILLNFNVYKGNTCSYQVQTLFMFFFAFCLSSMFSECHLWPHSVFNMSRIDTNCNIKTHFFAHLFLIYEQRNWY